MKRRKKGFTIIELLTVLAIMTLLVALLLPSVTMVRRIAKETQQKAHFTAIAQALLAFRSDYGDYPPSTPKSGSADDFYYTGAQRLSEALLGWDLLGFHPDSEFRSDGETEGGVEIYPTPLNLGNQAHRDNLKQRKGPYLELTTANAFRVGNISADKPGLFNNSGSLEDDTFVLCDVFGIRRITIKPSSGGKSVTVKAGTPILYYRANTSSKFHTAGISGNYDKRIYCVLDNQFFVQRGTLTPDGKPGKDHSLANSANSYKAFYDFITDPKVTAAPWPYRPDSYILITAGADGEYGTADDITNFGN